MSVHMSYRETHFGRRGALIHLHRIHIDVEFLVLVVLVVIIVAVLSFDQGVLVNLGEVGIARFETGADDLLRDLDPLRLPARLLEVGVLVARMEDCG